MVRPSRSSSRYARRMRTLTLAVFGAALLLTLTAHTSLAYGGADPSNCTALKPAGSFPSGFGTYLGYSYNDGVHNIAACSNGSPGYNSNA